MRALCAAIVTTGAMIGLGLTAIGIGIRYADATGSPLKISQLDNPLLLILVFLMSLAVIGIAMSFVGLAYHHERRHYERHFTSNPNKGTISSVIGE